MTRLLTANRQGDRGGFRAVRKSPERRSVKYAKEAEKFVKAGTDITRFMVPGKGMRIKEDRIVASQAFLLVDRQGILRGRWLPGNSEPFCSEKILKKVRELAGEP
jgi:hypothetical protein